jgi:O-antigen ligase
VDYTAHNSFVAITAEQGIIGVVLYLTVITIALAAAWRLPGDDRWLMLLMLLIVMIGQMSLTLQDRMYIWFAYALTVLNLYIKNNALTAENVHKVLIKV